MNQHTLKLRNNSTRFSKTGLSLFMLVILYCWLHSVAAGFTIPLKEPPCPGGHENDFTSKKCTNGGYIINKDRKKCKDRYYCYLEQGEYCNSEELQCSPELVCMCNKCQNCWKGNCNIDLCPSENNILKRWLKRFERNLIDYNA